MGNAKEVILCAAGILGMVWLAVLICLLNDKQQGWYQSGPEEEEEEPAGTKPFRPRTWWGKALFAPVVVLYVAVGVLLAIVLFPMVLIESIWPRHPPSANE